MCGVNGSICVMVAGCVWCALLYLCNGYRVSGVHGGICVIPTGCVVCMVVFV